jgi:hypothetical protein
VAGRKLSMKVAFLTTTQTLFLCVRNTKREPRSCVSYMSQSWPNSGKDLLLGSSWPSDTGLLAGISDSEGWKRLSRVLKSRKQFKRGERS